MSGPRTREEAKRYRYGAWAGNQKGSPWREAMKYIVASQILCIIVLLSAILYGVTHPLPPLPVMQ